jgi:hypothetical protein
MPLRFDKYIADNSLPAWEPKSYEKAAKGTANGSFEAPHAEFGGSAPSADPHTEFSGNTTPKLPPKSLPADFAGFDEATPKLPPHVARLFTARSGRRPSTSRLFARALNPEAGCAASGLRRC